MADNYLEKKMEEYRRGVSGLTPRRKITPSGHACGNASFLPFPPGLRVMVLCGNAPADLIKALSDAGCRVAFTGTDRRSGTETARATGAQHHPVAPSDTEAIEHSLALLRHNWRGDIQVIISLGYPLPPSAKEAYTIYIGDRNDAPPCSLGLADGADVTTLLWALLPQTRRLVHGMWA